MPELPNLTEWGLGPEDVIQTDLLSNLPTSGGYQTVMTAIDVFSTYLFAYPLIEARASNIAKELFIIMTKNSILPTTLNIDKEFAFTSTIVAETAQILGTTLECATTKHSQTWKDACNSQDKFENDIGGIPSSMEPKLATSSAQL